MEEEELIVILKDIIENEETEISSDSKLLEDLLLDSFLFIKLISEIEMKCSEGMISDSLLYLEEDRTVGELCKLINENTGMESRE